MTKEKELPKWFKGDVYEEGGIATNPFSGQSVELDRYELSMYDFVFGFTIFTGSGGTVSDDTAKEVQKCMDWFRESNPEAYMILLD